MEGFLQPNEDVNIEITFHPTKLSRDIRYESGVVVDGQPPLSLTLTGMCVQATAEAQTMSFRTRVREPAKQSIQIKNDKDTLWRIAPIISSEHWQGAEILEVPAKQSAAYEISYVPAELGRRRVRKAPCWEVAMLGRRHVREAPSQRRGGEGSTPRRAPSPMSSTSQSMRSGPMSPPLRLSPPTCRTLAK